MSERLAELQARYTDALGAYVSTHSESALFAISKLSKEFIREGLGPDDITNMHSVAMGRIINELGGQAAVEAFHISTEPLLEVMMNYAMSYHSNIEEHRRRLAEYENGEGAREQERLASVAVLLLGNVGEMINHLESIVTYTGMMAEGGISRAKELSQVLRQEAVATQEMLKAAFLYSRKLSRRADERTPMNLNDLLLEAIGVIRDAVALDSVAIQTNYRTPVKVNVHPAEMEQALVNVLASAIDAIGGNGNVAISSATRKESGSEIVELKLFATAGGSPRRNDIFSLPQARINAGLHIAAGIIKRHGGIIDVNGNDQGTAMVIRLPVAIRINDFMKSVPRSAVA